MGSVEIFFNGNYARDLLYTDFGKKENLFKLWNEDLGCILDSNLDNISFSFCRSIFAEPQYNPIGAVQNFGIGNMFLGIMVYIDCQQKQIKTFLKILVVSGICAAIFGVIQRLVGPPLFAAIGINLFDPNTFAFLSSNNLETQHLDVENGFRAFSFL